MSPGAFMGSLVYTPRRGHRAWRIRRSGRVVDDPLDQPGRVVRDVESAVVSHDDIDGPSQHPTILEPAGGEILHAAWLAILEAHADHLVPRPDRTVPGAVVGDEEIALIFRREKMARIKGETERCGVGLDLEARQRDRRASP